MSHPPAPINYPGYVPNLYDVRAAGELQPTVPCEGSVPALWDEECSPIEAWYMGYLYSYALARMQYAQQLISALGGMLQEGTIPKNHASTVLVVIKELESKYPPEDIVWYEGRLERISTKLCAYYQPASTNKESYEQS